MAYTEEGGRPPGGRGCTTTGVLHYGGGHTAGWTATAGARHLPPRVPEGDPYKRHGSDSTAGPGGPQLKSALGGPPPTGGPGWATAGGPSNRSAEKRHTGTPLFRGHLSSHTQKATPERKLQGHSCGHCLKASNTGEAPAATWPRRPTPGAREPGGEWAGAGRVTCRGAEITTRTTLTTSHPRTRPHRPNPTPQHVLARRPNPPGPHPPLQPRHAASWRCCLRGQGTGGLA